jgi:hypothetical protein
MPIKAIADSLHVATAAFHGIDFLMTWNCAHIANAERIETVREIIRTSGYVPPVICTPDELMGNDDHA